MVCAAFRWIARRLLGEQRRRPDRAPHGHSGQFPLPGQIGTVSHRATRGAPLHTRELLSRGRSIAYPLQSLRSLSALAGRELGERRQTRSRRQSRNQPSDLCPDRDTHRRRIATPGPAARTRLLARMGRHHHISIRKIERLSKDARAGQTLVTPTPKKDGRHHDAHQGSIESADEVWSEQAANLTRTLQDVRPGTPLREYPYTAPSRATCGTPFCSAWVLGDIRRLDQPAKTT